MSIVNKPNILKHYEFCHENANKLQFIYGSYGNVRLAKCLKTTTIVAIKAVYGILVKKEIENNIAINHINLIKLLDYFVDEVNICTWLIFQYPENGKLFQKLISQKEKDRSYIYSMLRTICEALQFLYYHGILLQYFNPDYIYIDKKNNIKICGLEFQQSIEEKMIRDLPIQYMAPEVLRLQHYNQKIYSWTIGIIFYQLIEGRTPFKGNNNIGQFINQLQKPINLINFRPQERQFLSKTLRIDPQQRYKLNQLLTKTILSENYTDSLTKSTQILKKSIPNTNIKQPQHKTRIKITESLKVSERSDRIKKYQNKEAKNSIDSRIKITEISQIKQCPQQSESSKINMSHSDTVSNIAHQTSKSNIQILGIKNIEDSQSHPQIQITEIKKLEGQGIKSNEQNPNPWQSSTNIFEKLRQEKKNLVILGQSKQKISLREHKLKKHDFKFVRPT